MKVILLNGPPRSGKDTIGEMLCREIDGAALFKFAQPIVGYMRDAHGIDMRTAEKDRPHEVLCGRTPREVAIAYSERMCKPLFGDDYFGSALARTVEASGAPVAIVTDSGFLGEAMALARRVGRRSLTLVRIFRAGHAFANDSRSYWPSRGIREIRFANDASDLDGLREKVCRKLLPALSSPGACPVGDDEAPDDLPN